MVLVGCGAPADTPGTGVESATPTLAPPTATRVPPTSTVTPDPSTATPTQIPPVGTDITIELPEGDPERGRVIFEKEITEFGLTCTGCHVVGSPHTIGPDFAASEELPAIGERDALRLAEESYTGTATTPEQYLFEAIVLPNAYYVEGQWLIDMPTYYAATLTKQDVADLIAYLLTLK